MDEPGDEVGVIGDEWTEIAKSDNGVIAAIKNLQNPYFGVQFHPEVIHTTEGSQLISNFYFILQNVNQVGHLLISYLKLLKRLEVRLENQVMLCVG